MAAATPNESSAVNLHPDSLQGSENREDRPKPAQLARDRRLESTTGKYNRRGTSNVTNVKNVPLQDRINQFPDQHLSVRGTTIFCNACREIVSSKKSILASHCSSRKHAKGKDALKRSRLREQTIAEALSREKTRKDNTLPLAEQAYRQEVVEEFLKAGIPIGKVDGLRPLLEKNGYRLPHSAHLGQYVSLIFKQEVERIKKELSLPGEDMTRDVSVIFDGSTRQGEAIAIILRFINDDWMITQRLIRIDICSKSVNSEELARVLNEALCVEFGIKANSLLAAMRDGASVNQAALDRIAFIFPKMLNIVCFSHTLDNVGKHLEIPTLLEFGNLWVRLFSHSHKAKLAWQDLTDRKPKSYSETRWWSKWEVYRQLLEQFGDVAGFLNDAEVENIAPKIVAQLRAILSDPQRLVDLKLELAVTIDVGEHFVKATYYLEGDGPLVFSCYEKLKAVAEACQAPHFPNVRAVAAAIANEDATQRAADLERKAKACVQPAILWFLQKFNLKLYDTVTAFKAARIMCPVAVQWMRPTPATVEALRILPFLDNDATINGLIRELPQYVAAARDVVIEQEEKKVEWWQAHADRLPNWSMAVKKILLVQPSSAAAERVFSILAASFNDQQDRALADYLQASVMLQYNKR